LWVARVLGALVVVVTGLWSVDALVVSTGVDGASVLVVTSKSVPALSVDANINSASAVVVTVNWSVHASKLGVAFVNSAWVVVVASFMVAKVDTSDLCVARVLGAWNVVVANLWRLDTSLVLGQSRNNAFVICNTLHWSEHALSSCRIANSDLRQV